MKLNWKSALGIALSVVLLVWTLRGESPSEIWSVLARSNLPLLILSALVATAIFPLRAIRWRIILDPAAPKLPVWALWRAIAIGMMVNNIYPARLGEIARAAGRKVSLTLSDKFCVDRHRESFRHLVAGHVDILFSNESEILSLYEHNDLGAALEAARATCPVTIVTRSAAGSLIATGAETLEVKAHAVAQVVDSTGAGDQYAAGFLIGYARNRPLPECGALASLAAAEVISHMGPRPEQNLRGLALSRGLRV